MGPLGPANHRLITRRGLEALAATAALLASATCGDLSPSAPHVGPGRAALSLAPSFATLPNGAPTIPLSQLRAILTRDSTEESLQFDAPFVGDSAVLHIEVQLTTRSATFGLILTALDSAGQPAYTTSGQITLHPGENPPPELAPLVYSGPDAGLQSLQLTVPNGAVTLNALAATLLSVRGYDSSETEIPASSIRVGWASRDTAIAHVDGTGRVTAGQQQGSTIIVARSVTGAADSIAVNVIAPVDHIVPMPTSLTLVRGTTGAVAAELRDITGHLIDDRTVVWSSSDATVATISTDGVVTALKIGTATFTASIEGKTATVPVTVISPIDHIVLSPSPIQFSSLGDIIGVSATLVPVPGASVSGLSVTFTSSAPAVARVDVEGAITSVANGTAKITATADGQSASVDVVIRQVAKSITVSPPSIVGAAAGQSYSLNASAVDAKGNNIDSLKVQWQSTNPNIATVAGDGGHNAVATVVHFGSAQILATADGVLATTTVDVPRVITQLIVTATKTQLLVGEKGTLSAQYADADGVSMGDATTVTYSTKDINAVSVDGNTVYARAIGTGTVLATDGTYSGSLDVQVIPAPPLVIVSDATAFSLTAVGANSPDQLTFFKNLLQFTTAGPRTSETGVMVYTGHGAACVKSTECTASGLENFLSAAASVGDQVVFADATPLDAEIDTKMKVLMLFAPTTAFTSNEIVTLKNFVTEGGRIVAIGEGLSTYTATGVDTFNKLLSDIGSTAKLNAADDQSCSKGVPTPLSKFTGDPITSNLTLVAAMCYTTMVPGTYETPVILDLDGKSVFAATSTLGSSGPGKNIIPNQRRIIKKD